MKGKGYLLTGFTALFLESWAAYFSIFGWVALLGQKFLGAAIGIEFAKIVMVGLIYNWRKEMAKWLKTYMWGAVVVTMLLTSIGVYGFLTNSYQQQQGKTFETNKIKTNFNLKNITLIQDEIKMYEEQKKISNVRLTTLNKSRDSQEQRLTAAMSTLNYRFIDKLRSDIERTDKDIALVSKDISDLTLKIQQRNIDLGKIQQTNYEIENESTGVDVGPLRWIGGLFNRDMSYVVNFLIIIIMFVFDPLAIMLLVAANMQIAKMRKPADVVQKIEKRKYTRKIEKENVLESIFGGGK